MDSEELGRRLAERHGGEAELDPIRSLLNYAESPYAGDWTLRSGLTRLAQPHPALVSTVLDLCRRLDAPLHHVRRTLESHVAPSDRAIAGTDPADPPAEAYGDVRTADLARLVAAGADPTDLLAGYEEQHNLEPEERRAVPLLAVAVILEQVAEAVAGWARTGPADPPVAEIGEFMATVASELDRLGVPEETGPPPRGARNRGV